MRCNVLRDGQEVEMRWTVLRDGQEVEMRCNVLRDGQEVEMPVTSVVLKYQIGIIWVLNVWIYLQLYNRWIYLNLI
jgi:hypothetical protein